MLDDPYFGRLIRMPGRPDRCCLRRRLVRTDLHARAGCEAADESQRPGHAVLAGPEGPRGPPERKDPPSPLGQPGRPAEREGRRSRSRSPQRLSALAFDNALTKIVSRYLPAGSWAAVATVNTSPATIGADQMRTTQCELQNPSRSVVGGAKDRRLIPNGQQAHVSRETNCAP
jgi:hypothetical protein